MLKLFSEKGNITTYEWTFGVKPTKIILPDIIGEESVML